MLDEQLRTLNRDTRHDDEVGDKETLGKTVELVEDFDVIFYQRLVSK